MKEDELGSHGEVADLQAIRLREDMVEGLQAMRDAVALIEAAAKCFAFAHDSCMAARKALHVAQNTIDQIEGWQGF